MSFKHHHDPNEIKPWRYNTRVTNLTVPVREQKKRTLAQETPEEQKSWFNHETQRSPKWEFKNARFWIVAYPDNGKILVWDFELQHYLRIGATQNYKWVAKIGDQIFPEEILLENFEKLAAWLELVKVPPVPRYTTNEEDDFVRSNKLVFIYVERGKIIGINCNSEILLFDIEKNRDFYPQYEDGSRWRLQDLACKNEILRICSPQEQIKAAIDWLVSHWDENPDDWEKLFEE